MSQGQKGSKRRAKAVQILAKAHLHIANQRKDFHHKTARKLVMQYGTIVHEDLLPVQFERTMSPATFMSQLKTIIADKTAHRR